ncbi:ran-binding protein 3-like isoform X1 [Trachemys scripta elegans]|uniref:ran-binding protein 3-like isoform X1 n=1 Tax=Trachemys scripta elegans TaxID=31138 RepID=UPI001557540A|nr:ran-binding protein 3-like isoform X1 [Trachemys scripta elegans]
MRHQEVPASEANVLYTRIGPSCTGNNITVSSVHHMKDKPCLTKRRGCPSDTWTENQATSTHVQKQTFSNQFHSSGNSELNRSDECYTETSVIAQPIFVFEKKERPFKRPAEDLVCKAENDFIGCSRKRARSSSFTFQTSDSQFYMDTALSQKRVRSSSCTILPTFPPSQPVKNNIFMTSALLQRNHDITRTEKGPLSQIQQWTVIRPAILQPPQSQICEERRQMCTENTLASSKTKEKANIQLSEESSYCPAENSASSETTVRPSISMHLSSPKTIGNQPVEDVTFLNNRNSTFVFGENMVERVLSPQKSPKLHNETDLCKKEITSTDAKTFHISYSHSKTFFVKKSTLIESAAAYISKPAQTYLLDKVEVITGEEAEHNVLQISCKLFVFNKLSLSWTERGRGSLRLNDTSSNKHGTLQSRLVMRNQGSLRLILNTKLWTQMVIERANRKSLCITATDLEDHSVKVFLIQASSKDTGYLYAAIHHRLVALRSFAEQELDANQVDTEPETAFHSLNCDSDDDDDEDETITQASSNGSDHSRWIRRQPVVCS